jgi:hypothetical protein
VDVVWYTRLTPQDAQFVAQYTSTIFGDGWKLGASPTWTNDVEELAVGGSVVIGMVLAVSTDFCVGAVARWVL